MRWVAERVWQEMKTALEQKCFARFVSELRACGALTKVLPEVDALFGVPQVEKYHPEVDTGIHTLMSLQAVEKLTRDPMVKFAVLVHDLGKACTPRAEWPRHLRHEQRGLKPIKALCHRLNVPKAYREFSLKVCKHHLLGHRIHELRPNTVLKLLEALDGIRNPDRVRQFALCCLADMRGRTGHEDDESKALQYLLKLHQARARY